jgi:rhamnose transport system permease protein
MASAAAQPSRLSRWFPNAEWVLLIVAALEVAFFGVTGTRFLSVENAMETTRLAAEVGLLAFGLTPVIKAGGIDLSVGSMMGLSAIVTGGLWSLGLPIWIAGLVAIGVGAAGGVMHGILITRFRIPPLIVTLGTFSLYRGLAEAVTGGYASYSGFSPAFLSLGQGYLGGLVPTQLPLTIAVFAGLWLYLHRAVAGRELTAIGFSPAGARFAGIRVDRAVVRAYAICGACAALAGIIFIARIGQAKADAGVGYELLAISTVVLGGTAITGGRGTLHGTLFGLICLVLLKNGLRLSGQPSEIASLCAGVVLLLAIILNRSWVRAQRSSQLSLLRQPLPSDSPGFSMKNTQVALIIAAIIAGALIIAASNLFVVRSLTGHAPSAGPAATKLVVAMTPKAKTDPYFVSVHAGADKAAAELGVDVAWDGPEDPDPAKQNEIVDAWITKGVDVIAASAASPEAISSVLRKAQARGIKVITWDADALPDARSFFVNQATAEGIGSTLADEGARLAGDAGEYAIITASLTDSNQNEWIKFIKERMASAHPRMALATIHPCDGQRDKAMSETQSIVRAYPGVKVILAICSPAVPGAAEALKQDGSHAVKLTGLSTPNLCRDYVKGGWAQSVVLWNTGDLGYLTVYAAKAVHDKTLSPGDTSITAGRLGAITVKGDQILLGKPFVFTKDNIDQFQF